MTPCLPFTVLGILCFPVLMYELAEVLFDLYGMATLDDVDSNCNGMVLRSISEKPPKHHIMKFMSFSSLKSEDRYESGNFEAGGYSWKLVLFPNGNKKRNVTDHISLYLEMAGEKPISTDLVVTVEYKLFLLNRQKEKKTYLVREDANKKYCFYRAIVGGSAGFDRFISLEEFGNLRNGYLVDDQCEFGAEVFVSEMRNGKGEMVAMNLNTVMYKHVWNVIDFSKLSAEYYFSPSFIGEDQKYCKWKIWLYPKGTAAGKGSHVSVFLQMDETEKLPTGSKILAQFKLGILDQVHGKHIVREAKQWFSAPRWGLGWPELITQEANAAFLKNDICVVETEFTILGVSIPGIS
ncbi:hypothetical protein ACLB2K_000478 [Fragaria x ananassa]